MKLKLRNTHDSPVGVNDKDGNVRVIQPGESLEVDLSDGEAAALRRDKGALRVSQSGSDDDDDDAEGEGEDVDPDAPLEADEAPAGEAGESGVVAPRRNQPSKGRSVVGKPKRGTPRKRPAKGR